jgi:hypothetical protein
MPSAHSTAGFFYYLAREIFKFVQTIHITQPHRLAICRHCRAGGTPICKNLHINLAVKWVDGEVPRDCEGLLFSSFTKQLCYCKNTVSLAL